jgi:Fur family transcriptional regulator, ferric uptake regulator
MEKETSLTNSELRKAGLKITGPRIKILHILESAKEHHLRAEEIYRLLIDAGEDIGLATVYRVLTQFEEAGLVIRHHFEEGYSVFELDLGAHHDHLVCIKCGDVKEFVDDMIEERQKDVATRAGYSMTDHSLTIYGFCQPCQGKQAK